MSACSTKNPQLNKDKFSNIQKFFGYSNRKRQTKQFCSSRSRSRSNDKEDSYSQNKPNSSLLSTKKSDSYHRNRKIDHNPDKLNSASGSTKPLEKLHSNDSTKAKKISFLQDCFIDYDKIASLTKRYTLASNSANSKSLLNSSSSDPRSTERHLPKSSSNCSSTRPPALIKRSCQHPISLEMREEVDVEEEEEEETVVIDLSDDETIDIEIVIDYNEEFDKIDEKSQTIPQTMPVQLNNQYTANDKETLIIDNDNRLNYAVSSVLFSNTINKQDYQALSPGIKQTDEKLNLVLDLDETLLNSFTLPRNFSSKNLVGISRDSLKEFQCGESNIIMVLRPYLFEFLERTSKLYNLYIYSHGRYEYVCCALDVIDKDEKYIKKSRIYKNMKQPKAQGLKLLDNFNMSAEEKEKTIIIDDYRCIWQEEQKVICSKKFIPLKSLINADKYNKYSLFRFKGTKEKENSISNIRWLSHSNQVSDLRYYSETSIGGNKSSQLEALADFLEDIANQYNLQRVSSSLASGVMSVEKLYEEKLRGILGGWKINIMSGCQLRLKTFEELAQRLGAEIVSIDKAEHSFIDTYLDSSSKVKLQNVLSEHRGRKIISVYWLVECFFAIKKVNMQDFCSMGNVKVIFKFIILFLII